MNIHTINSDVNKSNFGLRRTASKTVRKCTNPFGSNDLPRCITVCLDWFSCSVDCLLPEPPVDQSIIKLNDNAFLVRVGNGTPNYMYSYEVIIGGEMVAKVHTHGRQGREDKIIKPGMAKLEILNHVLYSSSFITVLQEVMSACSITKIRNYSEIHIAIDGANHVWEFLNKFEAHDKRKKNELRTLGHFKHNTRVEIKGRANWDSKRRSKKTGGYENFKIGSKKKYITVYNKTSDLLRQPKPYITEMWDKAGLDRTATVWRCELRMKSEAINEIKDFDLTRLNDPNYLLQIFKTHIKNFFEFVILKNDQNISRGEVIDLFQFEKLQISLLDRVPRAIVQGAHKARMAIHNAYANVRLHIFSTEESVNAALQHITDLLDVYHLGEWFYRAKDKWDQRYPSFQAGLT